MLKNEKSQEKEHPAKVVTLLVTLSYRNWREVLVTALAVSESATDLLNNTYNWSTGKQLDLFSKKLSLLRQSLQKYLDLRQTKLTDF